MGHTASRSQEGEVVMARHDYGSSGGRWAGASLAGLLLLGFGGCSAGAGGGDSFAADVSRMRGQMPVEIVAGDGGARMAVALTEGRVAAFAFAAEDRSLGQERLWLAPEWGPFSLFHAAGAAQNRGTYRPPDALGNGYEVTWKKPDRVTVARAMRLENAAGHRLDMAVERTFRPLTLEDVELALNVGLPGKVDFAGFATENRLRNTGDTAWTQATGTAALWPISSFPATEETVVIAPYDPRGTGSEVYGGYLGEPGGDRLVVDGEHGVILFRADGASLGKIGLNASRAKEVIGAIDFQRRLLMIVHYDQMAKSRSINMRPTQAEGEAFEGDVVLAYNHSGVDGERYFNLETVGPALLLQPDQSVAHHQRTLVFRGDMETLSTVSEKVLGVGLADVRRQMLNP